MESIGNKGFAEDLLRIYADYSAWHEMIKRYRNAGIL